VLVPACFRWGWFCTRWRRDNCRSELKDLALGEGDRVTAADSESNAAWLEAQLGNSTGARQHAAADQLGGQSAMALALARDTDSATKIADHLASQTPRGGYANNVRLPEIRAAIELKRGNPTQAVELFAPVAPFQAGWFDRYTPACLRGQAYLVAHRSHDAPAEFQKILDHRGVVLNT
jgi:eukaryotic-like serine/threonine-protein kinase